MARSKPYQSCFDGRSANAPRFYARSVFLAAAWSRPQSCSALCSSHERLERSDSILVLLDADDDCPAKLGTDLLAAASALGGPKVAVIAAVREFEAWFLAAAASLVAEGRLAAGATPPLEPEAVPDAKGWLSLAMGRRYSETLDQPAFAALFDVEAASRARSFAKLRRDLDRLLQQP